MQNDLYCYIALNGLHVVMELHLAGYTPVFIGFFIRMHVNKIQVMQALKDADLVKNVIFAAIFLISNNNKGNMLMNDEANFNLNGYVIKSNFCYLATANPNEMNKNPVHSAKDNVWCAISSFRIIGLYLF